MKKEAIWESVLAGISLVIAICSIVFLLSVMHTDYLGGAAENRDTPHLDGGEIEE